MKKCCDRTRRAGEQRISFLRGRIGAALFAVATAHSQNALDNVMKAKEIKIAIPTDFPPYGFVGPDLKPQGLDIDMANYIAG